ncbi:ATP-binding cassette domain-containing protein [Albibacterium bauzanense]|uniref:Molybdate transport system ATP-binding protein n=1 Tax=Albibacterium bauzanense TaxID=653929 RepID=A0A4V2PWU4_9SPHI|nr:ATP-binding cassette domain-containing protein [Albibacterium bauzanense]TCK79531.1 molybdate transport system ATP-binding protein [Albibacterium bauzanense]
MPKPLVNITNLNLEYQQNEVLKGLNWQIFYGENWLLGGKSGSGKTSLARAIAGLEKSSGDIEINFDPSSVLPKQVVFVSSWYQFTNLEGDRNFYYQQRYNKHQQNDTLTVYAELLKFAQEEALDIDDVSYYLDLFGFSNSKNTQLIELSSGENKKMQLIKALWLKPQLLIIDQPYTGLDAASRKNLNRVFDDLTSQGLHLILISNDDELPDCINRFAEIKNSRLVIVNNKEGITKEETRIKKVLPYFLQQAPDISAKSMVRMNNVNVKYGDKQVLHNVSWEVKAGEKWLLQGPNGSGKSTLLSLINGDHPQAYTSDIYLFGKKRGSGESIWDIKEHLGIISPELHWYFDSTARVWQSVASGFYDSIGLFHDLTHDKQRKVDEVLEFFDLKEYKYELLNTLPLGKQRLVLLARTIIKNPELLILDEPCQGLDAVQTQHFNDIVDELCTHGKTLIYVGHFETQLPTCIEKRIILKNGRVEAIESLTESIF